MQTSHRIATCPVEGLWKTNDLRTTVLIEVSHVEMPPHGILVQPGVR